MSRTFRPLEPLRGWRRLAAQTWRPPRDPSVYATLDIPMRSALAYLERLREETGVRVTVTHLVARGVALALRQYPGLNGIVSRGRIMLRDTVDIFLQVAIEGGRELSGIKIARADEKSVVEIAREMEERVERLRARRDKQVERTKSMLDRIPIPVLGPMMRTISYLIYDLDLDLTRLGVVKDEFGSAMVTNVGMFGLKQAFAPLVPFSRTPLVVLVGEVQERAVAEAGRVVARPVVTLGVTFDHRFMDGWHGGAMAQLFRAYIEDPARFDEPQAPELAAATPSQQS
ncbi:MAG TPA: 2-oxo acid dehydrogenase subunit E2 [Candidatus Binatia bacterium]|nr:2-oxo acid dehydrogenase subunit E2 [Candidatus Binatia bacterium]